MHILHISNDFGGTEVYRNLYQHLDDLGIKQTIFVPLNPRVLYRKGNHDFEFKTQGSKIVYSITQKWYHRFLYDSKIKSVLNDLIKSVDIKDINLIHAGTLCMTGAIAYEINKIYNIPFITAVRNTDINIYFKKMWWKKDYYYNILKASSNIIFISPKYKEYCLNNLFSKKVVSEIDSKVLVIPNGVDNFYFSFNKNFNKKIEDTICIVYAGGFKENKNLLTLIKAVTNLKHQNIPVKLIAVGKSLPNRKVSNNYISLLEKEVEGKNYIELLEFKEKEDLCELYKEAHLFAMVSKLETFGLSYVEALTQNLPVVYSKGQGFDGFYKNGEVGFSTNPTSVNDISKAILDVVENYAVIQSNINHIDFYEDFNWEKIAEKYLNIYKNILNV